MPKVVDHDQRRDELMRAVWRVVARDGLEGATMRSIALETGWSSGVLQHYFSSKRDIIVSAHHLAYQRAAERIEAGVAHLSAIEALRVALYEALPLDEERLLEARIEVSAWGLAASDPEFLRDRHTSVQSWLDRLAGVVAEARADGDVGYSAGDEVIAHEILALVDALSLEAVLYPHIATVERQMLLADALLDRIRGA